MVGDPDRGEVHDEPSALHAVHADEAGLFIERIELREHLATGAEGEVFRASHEKMRRPVAPGRRIEGPSRCCALVRAARKMRDGATPGQRGPNPSAPCKTDASPPPSR